MRASSKPAPSQVRANSRSRGPHRVPLKPAFVGLSLAAWPVGWVVSSLALGLLYYAVFTPVALVFRLIGRDALSRRFDRQAATYWEPYNPDLGTERYLRQF